MVVRELKKKRTGCAEKDKGCEEQMKHLTRVRKQRKYAAIGEYPDRKRKGMTGVRYLNIRKESIRG